MKFLFLYKYDPNYAFDSYFHLDLVQHYTKAGHKSMCYGPRVHEAYQESVIKEYNEQITLEEIYSHFRFDVIIVLTKSRCFDYYRPPLIIPHQKEERGVCWLSSDFKGWRKTPKIMIEEDFHYESSTTWYEELGFDIVFQRHKNAVTRWKQVDKHNIPCPWMPFSVDSTLFSSSNTKRINKISLKATVVSHIYPARQLLIDKLSSLDLLIYDKNRENYIEHLQLYVSHACSSSIFDITPAKMFEIMSSESILFTNEGDYGLEKLFDKDCYVCYNKDNIVDQARKIINNPEWVTEITNKGRQCILEKHTHEIRIQEMINMLKKVL